MATPAKSKAAASDSDPRALMTPSDLPEKATARIADAINGLLADAFLLYFKTKNFHWHVSGPHFRSIHLMLDEHGAAILATTDPLAERVRKLGQKTLHSLSETLKHASLKENNDTYVSPLDMLLELMDDNKKMAAAMREAHSLCDDAKDVATASLLENYIDETEKRTWFLFEASRAADQSGH